MNHKPRPKAWLLFIGLCIGAAALVASAQNLPSAAIHLAHLPLSADVETN